MDISQLSNWTIHLAAPGSGEKSRIFRDGAEVRNATSVMVFQKTGEIPSVVVTQLARSVEIVAPAKKPKRGKSA